ncbi:hypothetical protein FRC03_008320 [Tulasnella sp. 419]|nr:hypothetical protein FRC03_008320 [Tulasnella sp. 419]
MKALSPETIQNIISLLKDGYSMPKIQQRTGVGKSKISNICKEYLPGLPYNASKAVHLNYPRIIFGMLSEKSPLGKWIPPLLYPGNFTTLPIHLLVQIQSGEQSPQAMEQPETKVLAEKEPTVGLSRLSPVLPVIE